MLVSVKFVHVDGFAGREILEEEDDLRLMPSSTIVDVAAAELKVDVGFFLL